MLTEKILFENKFPIDPVFWKDFDTMINKVKADNNFYPVWPFVKKWGFSDALEKVRDLVADMHNLNKIPRGINFQMWLMSLIDFYYKAPNQITSTFILQNKLLTVYRGVSATVYFGDDITKEQVEQSLNTQNKFLSFTTSQEIAEYFLRSGYGAKINTRNEPKFGYIVNAQVPIQNVYLFNNQGNEQEVILKTPIKNYTIKRVGNPFKSSIYSK